MEKKTKQIDAVRLVRRIREAHHTALKDASRQERIAFYNGTVRAPQPRPTVDRDDSPPR